MRNGGTSATRVAQMRWQASSGFMPNFFNTLGKRGRLARCGSRRLNSIRASEYGHLPATKSANSRYNRVAWNQCAVMH